MPCKYQEKFKKLLLNYWYHPPSLLTYLLSPLSAIYRLIIAIRRYYLLRKKTVLPLPTIVVGNITLGGTGKTPFVIWLAQFLKKKGYRPGIISRGYRGKSPFYPLAVTTDTDPAQAGDEAILLVLKTNCPVVIDPDRVKAGQFLLQQYDCNILISDDGLQHYALSRDIEIALIDASRKFGNTFCLPAGPLREPLSRLETVDFIVINEQETDTSADFLKKEMNNAYAMNLTPGQITNLHSPELKAELEYFLGESVHAVAGIGNPAQFFNLLKNMGLTLCTHSFPDHHLFTEKDFHFTIDAKIIMTEKDAVKCRRFADYRYWCLPVNAKLSFQLGKAILKRLEDL